MPSKVFDPNFEPRDGITFSDPSDAYAEFRSNYITFYYVFGGSTGQSRTRFKAFITDYKDSYAVAWNEEQVYGRNDPIVTFQNTVRTITVSWVCPSASREEGLTALKRAAKLMRYCYPTYEDQGSASTISKPPLVRVKFKNFIKRGDGQGLLAAIGGFDFAPVIDDGFWDPMPDKNGVDPLIPKTIAFSCTMKILHEEGIGWKYNAPSEEDIKKAKEDNKPVKVAYSYWGSNSDYPFMPKGDGVGDSHKGMGEYEGLGDAWTAVYADVKKTTLEYWENREKELVQLVGSEGMNASEEQKVTAQVHATVGAAQDNYDEQVGLPANRYKYQREQEIKEMQALAGDNFIDPIWR